LRLFTQTDGVPNSSRCYWAPTPEEAVACWCRVCDFQRAIEICSVSTLFNKCDSCQMGRSLQDWTQSRCAAGGALTVRVNTLKGRSGVSEERWHTFSKVLDIGMLHSTYSKALTFRNLFQALRIMLTCC
jgi:hypothetical protein